jgi:hypothetical protein
MIAAAQRDRRHRRAMVDWKRDIRLSPLGRRCKKTGRPIFQLTRLTEKRALASAQAWRRLLIKSVGRFVLHEVNCNDHADQRMHSHQPAAQARE